MGFTPTEEQALAVKYAVARTDLAIKALAGTGKTSTLRLIAEALPEKSIQYVAFNKSIVTDATGSFPRNVVCSTAHALAMQAIGKNYRHRLDAPRMRPTDLAKALGLTPLRLSVDGKDKTLAAGFLAGLVKRAVENFCQTADREIGQQHVPYVDGIDQPYSDDRRGFYNNGKVRDHVGPALLAYWRDVARKDGTLPFSHGCYLKLWQLSDPTINADVILYDEAQDANPCMLSIVAQQAGKAQLIYVGDDYQQIYAWNGAVNALGSVHGEVAYLTQSFRFGDEVARAANHVLSMLGAEVTVKGTPTLPSVVGTIEQPKVILCRTNAVATREALTALKNGRSVALVGGAKDIVWFAEAAESLMAKGFCSHPDLSAFDSWGEVNAYVTDDPSGSDLKLMVDLVNDFGARELIEGLSRCTDEKRADLVISTAHKAKGREWDEVALAGDFPDPDKREPSDEELRLLYVAVTRAKLMLDIRAVKLMKDFQIAPDDGDDMPVAVSPGVDSDDTPEVEVSTPSGEGQAALPVGPASTGVDNPAPVPPIRPLGGDPHSRWERFWKEWDEYRAALAVWKQQEVKA